MMMTIVDQEQVPSLGFHRSFHRVWRTGQAGRLPLVLLFAAGANYPVKLSPLEATSGHFFSIHFRDESVNESSSREDSNIFVKRILSSFYHFQIISEKVNYYIIK